MATASDGLAQMSLEDFLQEEVVVGAPEEYTQLPSHPPVNHHISQRWNGGPNRWSGGVGSQRGAHRGAAATSWKTKGGGRPGVMLFHDPQPRRPFLKTSSSRPLPFESILTVGNHEALEVKEGRRAGQMNADLEEVMSKAQPEQEFNFILNHALQVKAGPTCHFLPVNDLANLRRDTLLKVLVGMLNTGEPGVVYLGVRENGRVEGITAETQLLTQFVEGLMKMMQFYLMPRVHAPQYGVRYNNVMTSSGQILNNMWVVELHAVPQMEHYYNALTSMDYYVRCGTDTKTLPFTTFCSAVVAAASEPYLRETSQLEEHIQRLRTALQEAGVVTSSVPSVDNYCWFTDCPAQCYGRPVVANKSQWQV
ncbi:hypothetical protein OTU49_002244 [Cherax quadricarinatus]|uniref:Schlafen AlbA-2 domain-containing protein n=1 Tax=Cherax quadricarinatus TaxID=27406 RepID=A0AAW0XU25_CHEQU